MTGDILFLDGRIEPQKMVRMLWSIYNYLRVVELAFQN